MWPKKRSTFVLVTVALVGCTANGPSLPLFEGSLRGSSHQSVPKVSREQAIERAKGQLPIASEFSLDLVMLTSPAEIESGQVPGKTGIAGVGFAAMGMLPDERFWLVRFKKGDPDKGPPYALLNYKVDAETAEAICLMSEGQALPGQAPFQY